MRSLSVRTTGAIDWLFRLRRFIILFPPYFPTLLMIFTPSPMLLKLLYNRGSLHNLPEGQG
ncbi:hypothetical protein [Hymenobacter sp. BRD67]|uniref:hypothetical protein n=1 Tax=Hymenobacter sp. BRD67 TaxID=2675877 RepID=UPI00293BEEEF|nr:hypothetical protein [Hymenobacter sp. BRD67]